jgi:hypothetical protein
MSGICEKETLNEATKSDGPTRKGYPSDGVASEDPPRRRPLMGHVEEASRMPKQTHWRPLNLTRCGPRDSMVLKPASESAGAVLGPIHYQSLYASPASLRAVRAS